MGFSIITNLLMTLTLLEFLIESLILSNETRNELLYLNGNV